MTTESTPSKMELATESSTDMECLTNLTIVEKEMQLLGSDITNDQTGTACTATITSVSVRKVRVVVSLVGKLVLPAVVGVYYAYLRNKNSVLETVRTQVVPAIITFLANGLSKSLSSVQGVVKYPSCKIDPILKVIKLRYRQPFAIEDGDISSENTPENPVTCCVLSEPSMGEEIKADVVFIHGLHGSIVKTWKQGVWKLREDCVPIERRASASCLQDMSFQENFTKGGLKRSATTYSNISAKILRSNNDKRVICNCEADECQCDEDGGTNNMLEDEEPYSECWPKDWLPKDCPGVRVIAITYTTDPYLWRPVWIKKEARSTLEERSNEMLQQLLQLGVGKNPIIWVGHSKGGLFVKQMLVDAWEKCFNNQILANLYKNTKGIMFYSVPHRGSSLASLSLPFVRTSVELLEVQKDCEKVLDLHRRFLHICNNEHFNPEIFSFIETSLTFMSFLYLRIVAFESADPGVGKTCGVPLDHREICKPRGRYCFLYQQLVELIKRVICNDEEIIHF